MEVFDIVNSNIADGVLICVKRVAETGAEGKRMSELKSTSRVRMPDSGRLGKDGRENIFGELMTGEFCTRNVVGENIDEE